MALLASFWQVSSKIKVWVRFCQSKFVKKPQLGIFAKVKLLYNLITSCNNWIKTLGFLTLRHLTSRLISAYEFAMLLVQPEYTSK
jgi:hypothetical protein